MATQWFRKTALSLVFITMIFALGIFAGIINMCTNSSHLRSLEADPYYNGTLGMYLVIVLIQLIIVALGIWGFVLSYRAWKNNYQMDHKMRHHLILWMSTWCFTCLVELAVAIYVIVRDKEPQGELAYLYQMFTKYNQESRMVGHFERYQRENSCCGIYGPDDWMLVTLRAGLQSGGGGGASGLTGGSGFQSLDYGFRQNPSTGQCHLTPPSIPMGCGLKMMEEIHYWQYIFAGMMILKTLIGIAAVAFVGYCFYYWLDKEVIVIPEDEVSNLIILEAESSTATTTADDRNEGYYSNRGFTGGGYLGGSRGPDFGPYPGDYLQMPPPTEYYGSRSRGASFYDGSYASGPRPTGYLGGSAPIGMYPFPMASVPGGTVANIMPPINTTGQIPSVPVSSPPVPSFHGEPDPVGPGSRVGPYDVTTAGNRYPANPSQQYHDSYTYRQPVVAAAAGPLPKEYLGRDDIAELVKHVLDAVALPAEQNALRNQIGHRHDQRYSHSNYDPRDPRVRKNHPKIDPESHQYLSQAYAQESRRRSNEEEDPLPAPLHHTSRVSNRGHLAAGSHYSSNNKQKKISASNYGRDSVVSGQRSSQNDPQGSSSGHSRSGPRHHGNLRVHHGNLTKLRSREKSSVNSQNIQPGVRIREQSYQRQQRGQRESSDFPDRSRSSRPRYNYNERTELLYKNPRNFDAPS